MNLEQIAISLRTRTIWEANDLGILVIRKWWKPVIIPWLLVTIPTAFIISLLPIHPAWAILILWFLLPWFTRIPLKILSRCIFNDIPSLSSAIKEIPQQLFRRIKISPLQRINFHRAFSQPVYVLENQTTNVSKRRINQLIYHTSNASLATTLLYLAIECLFALVILLLPALLLPENTPYDLWLTYANFDHTESHLWSAIYYSWAISIIIIEPIHVASGFTMYLSRRTELEAWDIELTFRKLAERLKYLVVIVPLLFFNIDDSHAKEYELAPRPEIASHSLQQKDVKTTIKNILDDPLFSSTKEETEWVYVGEQEDSEGSEFDWGKFFNFDPAELSTINLVAEIFRIIIWILLGVGLILLYRKRDQWLHWVMPKTIKQEPTIPDSFSGMDIRPQSLPKNIEHAAKELWQQQQFREASSLLYRGALSRLVNEHKLPLNSSAGELACQQLVQQRHPEKSIAFELTLDLWQRIAWAHQNIDNDHFENTLEHWKQAFNVPPEATT